MWHYSHSFFFNSGLWGCWHCGHPWPIVPPSGDSEDDCGEADGMYRLAGETEVLGENLPQRHFCPSKNPTWPDLGLNPGRRGGLVIVRKSECECECFLCSTKLVLAWTYDFKGKRIELTFNWLWIWYFYFFNLKNLRCYFHDFSYPIDCKRELFLWRNLNFFFKNSVPTLYRNQ
jgi:hypothetical protein